ncbi:MAG: anhydro-N-acetylmuramic acid kinase, partial [Myxococcota bacterium]
SEMLAELVKLDVWLGEAFAAAAGRVAESAGVSFERIEGIASHGQTVAHHPEIGGSLQIGSPSIIAERTGCRVVADFRPRDLAAGGEGAPLAPFFHHAVFTHEQEGRAILNLGGIANLTWLPARATARQVTAFDVGPANSLVDGVISLLSGATEGMDRDGRRARAGRIHEELLADLLADDYLDRPPPKSTGLERYGPAACEELLQRWNDESGQRSTDDLLATLVSFTAEAVGRAFREWLPQAGECVDRVLVGGGGVHNPSMMSSLQNALPGLPIDLSDQHGVPAGAAEAMAFSLLGRNALLGIPNHLPNCTGAAREAVLGVVVPGR